MHDEVFLKRYQDGGDLRDDHKNRTLMHFELVHYQLSQLRSALVVAAILGRTLVMPDFHVRLGGGFQYQGGRGGVVRFAIFGRTLVMPDSHERQTHTHTHTRTQRTHSAHTRIHTHAHNTYTHAHAHTRVI
ncbi:hypothetical protein T492DRAFT_183366 [Pavlovales sp. CCMP2436]|nr:hypothetical protein T492DRAFT_183366 [Pavlovales sp. CCMP2436]